MNLIEINPLDVQRVFPSFYHQDSRFFNIIHKAFKIGIYAVKKHPNNASEISLYVFKNQRNRIYYREGLNLLLNYPFLLGYGVIYIASREKSVVTLLCNCKKMGIVYMGIKNEKMWFKRERQVI
jgi:hypothetical protein